MKIISPYEFDFNPFYKFGKEWALIVVENENEDNVMTIAWGQVGILWSKPVLSVYVRNNRYTYNMMYQADKFSVCFFSEKYKDKLGYCGTNSRRDVNKIDNCGFTRVKDESTLYLKEAKITFILKKIHQIDLTLENACNEDIKKHYSNNEFHTQYIGEIEKIIVEE